MVATRDLFGNFINEGDTVAFPLTAGNFLLGKIEKITSGLDNQPPMAFVTVAIPMPIHSSGMIQGVIHVKVEEEKKLVV
jgi:hypothetical protein